MCVASKASPTYIFDCRVTRLFFLKSRTTFLDEHIIRHNINIFRAYLGNLHLILQHFLVFYDSTAQYFL